MKADFSSWTHKPENPTILKAYAENAIIEGVTRGEVPSVVWRDGEATLTLTPQEGEQTYDFKITNPLAIEVVETYDSPIVDSEEEALEKD